MVQELQPQPFVLGWLVEDIDATADALVAAGVQPLRYEGMDQDGAGVWTAPGGARVLWFTDPRRQHPLPDRCTLSADAVDVVSVATQP